MGSIRITGGCHRAWLAALATTALVLAIVAPASAGVVQAPVVGDFSAIMQATAQQEYAPDHVIVQMDPGVRATSLVGEYRIASATDIVQDSGVTTVQVPEGTSVESFAAALAQDPNVAYACLDYVRYPTTSYAVPPNDPLYASTKVHDTLGSVSIVGSWWLKQYGLNMEPVWEQFDNPARGAKASGTDIKVAVLDTGFYTNHPDMGANIVPMTDELQSYTGSTNTLVIDQDVTPVPADTIGSNSSYSAHGTGVAGEVSAASNNATGVASASYDTVTMVYKVGGLYYSTPFTQPVFAILDSAIIRGINDAVADGAKIINMSLGSTSYSSALAAATTSAHNAGVLVVAATGNEGASNGVYYPAANPYVVGVGAYYYDGAGKKVRADLTNYGAGADSTAPTGPARALDILAPGINVYSLGVPNSSGYEYINWAGTSMAAPAYAAAAAAVWRFAPDLSADELVALLANTAERRAGESIPSAGYGYGFVNPSAAVASLSGTSITAAASTVRYDQVATLSGQLTGGTTVRAGESVVLERSSNGGATWSGLAVVTTGADGGWSYRYDPAASWERNQLVRATYTDPTGEFDPATATATMRMVPRVTTPTRSVTTPTRGRSFRVNAYLWPRFSAGSSPARAYFYRKSASGTYYLVTSRPMTASNYSTYSKISASATLTIKGSYRVRVVTSPAVKTALGGTLDPATSGYSYFTVK